MKGTELWRYASDEQISSQINNAQFFCIEQVEKGLHVGDYCHAMKELLDGSNCRG